jgi:hypothetical protein
MKQVSMEVFSGPESNGEHNASMTFHDIAARPLDRGWGQV